MDVSAIGDVRASTSAMSVPPVQALTPKQIIQALPPRYSPRRSPGSSEEWARFAHTGVPFAHADTAEAEYWREQHRDPDSVAWRMAYASLIRSMSPDERLFRASYVWTSSALQYWLAARDGADVFTRAPTGLLRLVEPFFSGMRLVIEVRGPADLVARPPVPLSQLNRVRLSLVGESRGVLCEGDWLERRSVVEVDPRLIGPYDLRIGLEEPAPLSVYVTSVWCGSAVNAALLSDTAEVAKVRVYLTGAYGASQHIIDAEPRDGAQGMIVSPRELPISYAWDTAAVMTLRLRFVSQLRRYYLTSDPSGPWAPYETQVWSSMGSEAPFVLTVSDARSPAAMQAMLYNDSSTSRGAKHWPADRGLPDVGYAPDDLDDDAEARAALALDYACNETGPELATAGMQIPHGTPAWDDPVRLLAPHPTAKYNLEKDGYGPAWLNLRFSALHPSPDRLRRECTVRLEGDDPFRRIAATGLSDLYVCILPELQPGATRAPLRLRHTIVRLSLYPSASGTVNGMACAVVTNPLRLVDGVLAPQ